MLLVGLTGGIGSGKSTVADMLEKRGAVIIDADELARRAVDPGTPGYTQVAEAFGGVDRERLARVVFSDPEARHRLESIVHPEVARLFAEAVAEYQDTHRVVVYVVPLLVERGLQSGFDVVVAIASSPETRLQRLTDRGMSREDASARMSAQLSDEERAGVADVVLDNEGSLEELERAVDDLWTHLERRTTPG